MANRPREQACERLDRGERGHANVSVLGQVDAQLNVPRKQTRHICELLNYEPWPPTRIHIPPVAAKHLRLYPLGLGADAQGMGQYFPADQSKRLGWSRWT